MMECYITNVKAISYVADISTDNLGSRNIFNFARYLYKLANTAYRKGGLQMLRRLGQARFTLGLRYNSYIPSCPPPSYDTGCTYCQVPEFPEPIDFEKNLNGTKVLPWKHVLLLSHGCDNFDEMPSKIEMVPGSINSDIEMMKKGIISAFHPIMVSNILLTNQKKVLKQFRINTSQDQLVYLYPDRKIIRFDRSNLQQFIENYLVPKDYVQPEVYNPFKKEVKKHHEITETIDQSLFEEFPIEKDLVLICGHTKRDIRCGKLGPILHEEFEEVLSIENLDGSTELGLISHIGGHAYAGNVIILPQERKKIVWYGRVFPENVQGIVRETMKNDKIIKDLYRGDIEE